MTYALKHYCSTNMHRHIMDTKIHNVSFNTPYIHTFYDIMINLSYKNTLLCYCFVLFALMDRVGLKVWAIRVNSGVTWWTKQGQYPKRIPSALLRLYQTRQYVLYSYDDSRGIFVEIDGSILFFCRLFPQSSG